MAVGVPYDKGLKWSWLCLLNTIAEVTYFLILSSIKVAEVGFRLHYLWLSSATKLYIYDIEKKMLWLPLLIIFYVHNISKW